jgi:hypothetical protein
MTLADGCYGCARMKEAMKGGWEVRKKFKSLRRGEAIRLSTKRFNRRSGEIRSVFLTGS